MCVCVFLFHSLLFVLSVALFVSFFGMIIVFTNEPNKCKSSSFLCYFDACITPRAILASILLLMNVEASLKIK